MCKRTINNKIHFRYINGHVFFSFKLYMVGWLGKPEHKILLSGPLSGRYQVDHSLILCLPLFLFTCHLSKYSISGNSSMYFVGILIFWLNFTPHSVSSLTTSTKSREGILITYNLGKLLVT